VLSLVGHVIVLALIITMWPSARPQIEQEKYVLVETIPGAGHLIFTPQNAKPGIARATPLRMRRNIRLKHPSEIPAIGYSAGLQALRGRAQQATKGLMADLKFRGIYGFSPGDYKLPVQTFGDLPPIAASELPSRFEQYLTVEVTIDSDGRVADARVVSGEATPKIAQTLISAILGFKYIPAKRNGAPIPSQLDIVVHIPS
jgi:hypothetical protein